MATHSLAAPRDNVAMAKTAEAMQQYFAAGNLDAAESQLLGIDKACGDQCTMTSLARIWADIGIVRCRRNSAGADVREAFDRALDLDPRVELDAAYAEATAKQLFATARLAKMPAASRAQDAKPAPTTPATTASIQTSAPASAPTASPAVGATPVPLAPQPPGAVFSSPTSAPRRVTVRRDDESLAREGAALRLGGEVLAGGGLLMAAIGFGSATGTSKGGAHVSESDQLKGLQVAAASFGAATLGGTLLWLGSEQLNNAIQASGNPSVTDLTASRVFVGIGGGFAVLGSVLTIAGAPKKSMGLTGAGTACLGVGAGTSIVGGMIAYFMARAPLSTSLNSSMRLAPYIAPEFASTGSATTHANGATAGVAGVF